MHHVPATVCHWISSSVFLAVCRPAGHSILDTILSGWHLGVRTLGGNTHCLFPDILLGVFLEFYLKLIWGTMGVGVGGVLSDPSRRSNLGSHSDKFRRRMFSSNKLDQANGPWKTCPSVPGNKKWTCSVKSHTLNFIKLLQQKDILYYKPQSESVLSFRCLSVYCPRVTWRAHCNLSDFTKEGNRERHTIYA